MDHFSVEKAHWNEVGPAHFTYFDTKNKFPEFRPNVWPGDVILSSLKNINSPKSFTVYYYLDSLFNIWNENEKKEERRYIWI